jgi:integrase
MTIAAPGRHSEQLTPLDAALWGLDSVTAPMHRGWVAELACPTTAPRPTYRPPLTVVEDALRDASVTGAGLRRRRRATLASRVAGDVERYVATLGSLARDSERTRIPRDRRRVELLRRAEKQDHRRSIPAASLARLWERRDVKVRERTLWRLLDETAARADEVLRLDVEDLDIAGKRARTRFKGGDVALLFFGSGSARLLPGLIAGHRAGPVFLSSLRPSPACAAAGDICPLTGRAPVLPPRARSCASH